MIKSFPGVVAFDGSIGEMVNVLSDNVITYGSNDWNATSLTNC